MRREQRLRRPADFAAVHRRGRAVSCETLVLRSLTTSLPVARVGFAVGKRVGGAVVRNRVKRRLRAAVAATALIPGRDIVVIARPPAAQRDYAALAAGLHSLLERARLLQPAPERGQATPQTGCEPRRSG